MSNTGADGAHVVSLRTSVFPMVPSETSWTRQVAEFGAILDDVANSVTSWTELEQGILQVVDANVAHVLLLHGERSAMAGSARQLDVVLGRVEVNAVDVEAVMCFFLVPLVFVLLGPLPPPQQGRGHQAVPAHCRPARCSTHTI